MSVKKCDSKDCFLLSNAYIPFVGYICNKCINDFKSVFESTNETDLIYELSEFMNKPKNKKITGRDIFIDEFFKKHKK